MSRVLRLLGGMDAAACFVSGREGMLLLLAGAVAGAVGASCATAGVLERRPTPGSLMMHVTHVRLEG
jgi:hypothetical protein